MEPRSLSVFLVSVPFSRGLMLQRNDCLDAAIRLAVNPFCLVLADIYDSAKSLRSEIFLLSGRVA